MKYTDIPSKVPLPFASSGSKNTIPTDSQIGITPGAASLTDGFPPLTFTPVAAGGVPPSGKDFNGIFNLLSANARWTNAGGFYKYDATFSSAVGGYPNGAVLLRADDAGLWISTADDNTSDPDSGGANWTGIPFGAGAKSISANTTLTVADAGLIEIDASGGNVLVTLPAAAVLAGLSYQFARTDSNSSTVTITAAGSDTIEGAASITLSPSDRATLVADGGTSWRFVGARRAGDASQTFAVSDAINPDQAASRGQIPGIDQTWGDYTSNRSNGTTYTNSTNKPIEVVLCTEQTQSGYTMSLTVNVNSVTIVNNGATDPNVFRNTTSFTVPPGGTYSVSWSGTKFDVAKWSELR